jgi:hypothetical protein
VDTYKKNKAILKAGKIRPTRGTKIEGKKAAAIFLYYYQIFESNTKNSCNNLYY